MSHALSGFVRLAQIVGNPAKGIPPLIPVAKSTWWAGVKSGKYPKPVKLSKRITVWRISDIEKLIASVECSKSSASSGVKRHK